MAEPTPNPAPQGGQEPPSPEPTPNPAPQGGQEPTPNPEPTPPAPSFSQADIDAAVEAARKEWEEQQKLNSLPEDEKGKEQLRLDREKYNKDREALDRRILEQDAADMLREKGIDTKFAKQLCGKDTDETKTNIESFAEAWNTAISAGVESKLKGKTPKTGGGQQAQTDPFLKGFGM